MTRTSGIGETGFGPRRVRLDILSAPMASKRLWSRIVYSFRASLFIAICAVPSPWPSDDGGAGQWTFGGWVDALLMRITEVQMAFPFIVLALAILSAVRPTPLVLVVVLSLSACPSTQ